MKKNEIGEMIKVAMKQQGYTVRSLAEAIGTAHPQVIRVTNGASDYRIDTLFKILDVLNLELSVKMINSDN